MPYLNPTNDIVFKKLFGTEANKDLLINFLNAILERKGEDAIVDVDFTNPYNHQPSTILKVSIVDVRCTDKIGNNYIVEMQVDPQSDYLARCHYYTACGLSLQLKEGDAYEKLLPVVFLGIANFTLFPDHNRYLSHYRLLDTADHICRLKHEEYHFIELKKFKKTLDQLESNSDEWIYFLRHAQEYDEPPKKLEKIKSVAKAFNVLERSKWNKQELEAYEKIIDLRRVEASKLKTATEIGRQEGIKKGRQEGIEEGQFLGIIKVAKEMLSQGLPIETICNITGLSKQELEKIKCKK